MKKSLMLAIVGMTAGVVSSYGQGFAKLDNYNSQTNFPLITYGAGSGGTVGAGIGTGFTVGIYFGDGAFAGSVAADPSGTASPTSLNAMLVFSTNPNSTAPSANAAVANTPGYFANPSTTQVNSTAGGISTLEIVAWLTSAGSYDNSSIRGHSAAFQLPTKDSGDPNLIFIGDFMPTFSVLPVPEPSTFALIGLGTGALLFFRRRK